MSSASVRSFTCLTPGNGGTRPSCIRPCPGGATLGTPPRPEPWSVLCCDRAEEPVGLVVDAGGEVQRVRIAVRAGVAELECPEPVDRELPVLCGAERAAVLEAAVPHLRVGVDLPVAEVADQQVAAKAAERLRRLREPPRGVELPVLGYPTQELPVEV